MLTLTVYKRHEKGSATYINTTTRAKVMVSRKMFAGEPPDTIEIGVSNLAEATERDLEKAKRLAARDATRVVKTADLKERHARAKAKAEKLEKRLLAHEAEQAAKAGTTAPAAETGQSADA